MTKENFKLIETKEVSLDHPDTVIIIDDKEYTLSFKNVKMFFYEKIEDK